MSGAVHQERNFQDGVVQYLGAHGWLTGRGNEGYDKKTALYLPDLFAWLEESDPDNYARVVRPGTDAQQDKARRAVVDRVARTLALRESDGGGTLNALRKGVAVIGARKPLALMQVPPTENKNQSVLERYAKNRLRVVEELVYSENNTNRLDLTFFLNGIPVATAELKTEFTQSLNQGKEQYAHHRLPKGEPLLTPGRGALVHFVVTDERIAMTTVLKGKNTFFLPFDLGHDGGEGNPPNPNGHRTAYFWEQILQRDTWLTLLSKFVYTNHQTVVDPITQKTTDKTQVRFPRFHQFRAVTKIAEAAALEGPGHNYLIQHSAGSGKTDSIAWTAHRLASLHYAAENTVGRAEGEKVFDTVFVLADRQILDRQLQDAVRQLQNVDGTFQAITSGTEGSKTKQLIDIITTGSAKIVGVTLQTFPHALQALRDPDNQAQLQGKRFAVIADEAHSSQSGSASKAVKELLYLAEAPSAEDLDLDEPGADQDALIKMAAHADSGHRISYFAFTATPKEKTMQLFGRRSETTGELEPFDLYPMKQAIQEGFILDVLQNYTTWDMAARIAEKAKAERLMGDGAAQADHGSSGIDDQEIDVRRGSRAYIDFVELHPTHVASKVDVILKHYSTVVQKQLGGRAKAMVVTESRAAAVKYQRAFEKAIRDQHLPLKTLVAFSGEVPDPDVTAMPGAERPTVTEATMNPGLKGRDLAKVFDQADQNILIVANKYQTGFDQPLLVAMYVDKSLSDIAAVQTLSRLNRVAPNKKNTYVFDFVNDPDQILAAFQKYYQDAAIDQESDPYLVANLLGLLESRGFFTWAEVNQLYAEWVSAGAAASRKHGKVSSALEPAVERFTNAWKQAVLAEDSERLDELVEFRKSLGSYTKAYSFFSQVFAYGDPRYEKFSVFADLLARRLREFAVDAEKPRPVDVDDVVLTHFKLEKMLADENLRLADTADDERPGLVGMTEAGLSSQAESELAARSEVIAKVNKYFGDLAADERYQVDLVIGLRDEIAADSGLKLQAQNNVEADFYAAPNLRLVAEDAIWKRETDTAGFFERARQLSGDQLVDIMRAVDLFGRLRRGQG
ncbi:MAG: type I restriction endonuclease subunit R [Galactobacter sp.]